MDGQFRKVKRSLEDLETLYEFYEDGEVDEKWILNMRM